MQNGFQEPDVVCPRCQTRYTFEQAVKLVQMRCPDCLVDLSPVDNNWLAGQVAGSEGLSNAGQSSDEICVAELWLPAHNVVDAQAVRQFISSLTLPISLEYFGQGSRRVMLARGPRASLKFMAGQIASVWPKAYLKILDEDPLEKPFPDPSGGSPEPRQYELVLGLAEPQYLPIRIWESFLKGDPVHNLFAATLELTDRERVWMQVFAERNARPKWLSEIQGRLKLEQQRGFVITQAAHDGSAGVSGGMGANLSPASVSQVTTLNFKNGMMYIIMVCLALLVVVLGLMRQWWLFATLAVGFIGVFGLLYRILKPKDDDWSRADLQLIRQKVVNEDALIRAFIRVNVWASDPARAQTLMKRFLSSLSQYSVSGGNRFKVVPGVAFAGSRWPTMAAALDGDFWCWLTADELGGLWHPPLIDEQVSPGLVPVRGIEMRAPDPVDVEGFYQIGNYYRPDGETGEVRVSERFLEKSCLLVGKPGSGKSILMEHLVLANLESRDHPAVVVIDPHGDMAERLMGTIHPSQVERIRVLDIGDPECVLTYNPLDVRFNRWDVDQAAQIIIDIGSSLWAEYWGPRMQVPLKRGVMLIAAANQMRPEGQAFGLSLLNALLNANKEVRKRFIETELDGSPYQDMLARYFFNDYNNLSQNLREQIIQPVVSKASRFEENPLLALFSASSSKLDLTDVIRDRLCLIVNTRMSKYGKELSGFVGSMIVDLLIREVTRQGEQIQSDRVPVVFCIDEFQTFTGVAWQELLAQLRKWGGRTILGTQSLASLREQNKELVGQIMSGVFPLFAFSMNGEDADYLSKNELSAKEGGPSADTLVSLDAYSAYVRMIRQDGKLTRPFFFTSRPPSEVDPATRRMVWERRQMYSAPLVETAAEASRMLNYLDTYGGNLLSGGVTSTPGVAPARPRSPMAEAANVLRSASRGQSGPGGSPVAGGNQGLWTSLEALGEDVPGAGFDDVISSAMQGVAPVPGVPRTGEAGKGSGPSPLVQDDTVQEELEEVFGEDFDKALGLDDE